MSDEKEIPIPESMHEILASNPNGMLSTMRKSDGLISTNPVGFVWDGERVRISTIKSRIKYRNLVNNPTVTFCVLAGDDHTRYVELRGHATLEDDSDRSFIRRQFIENSGGSEPPPDLDPPEEERVIITIHPHSVSSPTLYGGRFSR